MKFNKFISMVVIFTISGQIAKSATLTLNSSKLPNGSRDITVAKTVIDSGNNSARFTLKFRGDSINNSKDVACNQDLTPNFPIKFISPLDSTLNCNTSIQNMTQLHCPNGLFEITISVFGSNCDNYVDLLVNARIDLTGSVTQEISLDDLTDVNFILK